MKRLLALLTALIMLCLTPCAYAQHYGWAFVIYDLGMSIEIDNAFTRTDDETLAQTNGFERSGNVKPDLILEVFSADTHPHVHGYGTFPGHKENASRHLLGSAPERHKHS